MEERIAARKHFSAFSIAQAKLGRQAFHSVTEAVLCAVGRQPKERKHHGLVIRDWHVLPPPNAAAQR